MGFRLLDTLYRDAAMADIWSEHRTVEAWLETEAALARAQADEGVLERSDAEAIAAVCRLPVIDLEQLWEQARNVGYPILPLIRMISAALPEGPDGRVHWGATTQDIMDTGLSLQLGRAGDRLQVLLIAFGDALAASTAAHAGTVTAARTHAQQAVPTTFGAKLAVYLGEVTRHLRHLEHATEEARVVSLYGAGGTNAALGPASDRVRRALAGHLGLAAPDVPWHVARDRVARFGLTCAAVAATTVRFAREIIDLARTEIAEVREPDGHHRGASSTMPQKANPIYSEAMVGFGVTAGGTATTLLRAMEAGHERSAGEWQIEWTAVPAVAEATAAALSLAAETAAGLRVFPEAMARNLTADGGLLMAEALMIKLAGPLGRERAHDLVYAAVERARKSGTDLVAECRAQLPAQVAAELSGLDHGAYLGEAPAICAAALRDWRAARPATTPSMKEAE